MTKRNKVKTTLDKRHKDKVSYFESHDIIQQDLTKELESNTICFGIDQNQMISKRAC